MERNERPVRAYLAEFCWAFLLINLMAGAVGLLVGVHMDSVAMGLALFLGGSFTVTLLLALVVAGTLAWDLTARWLDRRRTRRGGASAAR